MNNEKFRRTIMENAIECLQNNEKLEEVNSSILANFLILVESCYGEKVCSQMKWLVLDIVRKLSIHKHDNGDKCSGRTKL